MLELMMSELGVSSKYRSELLFFQSCNSAYTWIYEYILLFIYTVAAAYFPSNLNAYGVIATHLIQE